MIKLTHNTTVIVNGPVQSTYFYGTEIVRIEDKGAGHKLVTLNNGSWVTPSTVRRMNAILTLNELPITVYRRLGKMYAALTAVQDSGTAFKDNKFEVIV